MFKLVYNNDTSFRFFGPRIVIVSRRNAARFGLTGEAAALLFHLIQNVGPVPLTELARQRNHFQGPLKAVAEVVHTVLTELEHAVPLSYEDLIKRVDGLFPHAMEHRLPLFAGVDLTYVCNLRCVHCYVLHKVTEPKPNFIDKETAFRTIDSLAELGCLDLTMTGGEITLHRDYRAVLSYAKDRHIYTIIKTNGTTMSQRNAETYAQDAANETHLSLYGSTAEVHERMTAIPGSFEKTLAGMRELTRAGIKCKINVLVWKMNANQLADIITLVKDLGHEPHLEDIIHGRLNGDRSPREMRITPETRAQLEKEGFLDPFDPAPCTAGAAKIKINGNGGVATCELLPTSFGNVFQESLSDIWHSHQVRTYSREILDASHLSESQFPILSNRNCCPGLNLLTRAQLDGPTVL